MKLATHETGWWLKPALALPIVVAACGADVAAADEPLFPFVISYDAPQNITDLSNWLDAPAGKHGFVRIEDGRMVTDAGPIRFWGTNLCAEACFPSRQQAERLAARLARLGINCVRMHHMDGRTIWGKKPDKLTVDPEMLGRLDFLIYQLKRHGIYTNINLHVSRWFGPAEGFVARAQRPKFDKGLDNFEPRMIRLQKKYARDLLTHVNPYTSTSYAREPAVAMVEINNENALFGIWSWGQIDELPDPYATTFRKLWNHWLRKKYGNSKALAKVWNVGSVPLGGEMLKNGDFSQPLRENWALERDQQTAVEWSIEPATPPDMPPARRALRIIVTRQGRVVWHPQLKQAGLSVKKGHVYTLTCRLRASRKRRITINCMMAHPPWKPLGLSVGVDVGPSWKHHRFTFLADRDNADRDNADHDNKRARITFSRLQPATYELAEVSLRPGGLVGLEDNQRLEDDSVPVLQHGRLNLTKTAQEDFVDFLRDTEQEYWLGMHRFLKDELGVRPPVSGTQLSYSPVHIQARLDYIDAHAYWQHPHFPRRRWDPKDWTVHNIALVNSPGGTLARLAARRVGGMAYTVSEYNHPAPNVYAAEGFPMLAAFGAFQSWDGLFSFCYSHNHSFQPQRIEGFFDIKSDTPKIAHLAAAAALFLRGDVAAAQETLAVPLSAQAERQQLCETLTPRSLTTKGLGLDPRLSLLHAVAMDLREGISPPDWPKVSDGPKTFVSDTRELRWDVSQPGAGYFVADTPRTKLFTGFVRGRTFQLGNVTLAIGRTRLDWATVSMVCIDGPGFDHAGRILIAATGWAQNKNARLEDLGDDRVTLRDQWGSEPVLCEGVPAAIILPVTADRASFYPLDTHGHRRAAVPVTSRNGKAALTLGPEHKTVWYEVEVR